MTAKQYRKKPVVIEAMHLASENDMPDARAWARENGVDARMRSDGDSSPPYHLDIPTLEGVMRAEVGDYVIRGIKGEFYPCKADIFEATYDAVDTSDPLASVEPLETA